MPWAIEITEGVTWIVTSVPAVTETVALAVALPEAFVAVSMYVVVAEGVTVVLDPVTVPIPGSMAIETAPVTFHASVAEPPGASVDGDAVKDAMVGATPVGISAGLEDWLQPDRRATSETIKETATGACTVRLQCACEDRMGPALP